MEPPRGEEVGSDLSKEVDAIVAALKQGNAGSFKLPPEGVNVYDLLRHEHLILTKGAVAALEARCK